MASQVESNQEISGNRFEAAAAVGSPAPDFEACDTSGRVVRLSDYWRDSPVVVIFLRFLGCPFCRQQVIALRDHYAEFQAAGAQVACVAMGSDKVGRAFQVMFALPFPLLMLGDGDTRPYRRYGLARGGISELFAPHLFLKIGSVLRALGWRAADYLDPGDKRQMPGAFIIDTSGTLRFAYRSR